MAGYVFNRHVMAMNIIKIRSKFMRAAIDTQFKKITASWSLKELDQNNIIRLKNKDYLQCKLKIPTRRSSVW